MVTTASPIRKSSTATSPPGVRMRVPPAKHTTVGANAIPRMLLSALGAAAICVNISLAAGVVALSVSLMP